MTHATHPTPVHWDSPAPTACHICKAPITHAFIDARGPGGWWTTICSICFNLGPFRLGTGHGQLYKLQPNGDWLKTAG